MYLNKAKKNNKNQGMERTVVNRFLKNVHRQDCFPTSIPNLGLNVSIDYLKSINMGRDMHGNKKAFEDTLLAEEIQNTIDGDFDLMEFI